MFILSCRLTVWLINSFRSCLYRCWVSFLSYHSFHPNLITKRKNEWKSEHDAGIFQDSKYQGETWRLDFAKEDISVEVGFNHSSVIAWNLIKPVLASELNHIEKSIQTKIGVVITVTNEMKEKGGFDNAIGTYEKYLDYLKPLNNILTIPILIIGIKPPRSFSIAHHQIAPRKKIGQVIYY